MDWKFIYDGPVDGMSEQQIYDAEEFIVSVPYVVIGTLNEEGTVRLSALGNLPGQSVHTFYFATGLRSQKIRNILGNPDCEIMMIGQGGQLIIGGKAEIVLDEKAKEAKWRTWMSSYVEGMDDENYCIIRFTSEYVRGTMN